MPIASDGSGPHVSKFTLRVYTHLMRRDPARLRRLVYAGTAPSQDQLSAAARGLPDAA